MSLILPVMALGSTIIMLETYPIEWQQLVEWNGEGSFFDVDFESPSTSSIVIGIIGGLFLIASIASFVGLFIFKRWARTITVILTALTFIGTPFMGVVVLLPVEAMLFDLSATLYGVMLAMCFLPPISNHFSQQT